MLVNPLKFIKREWWLFVVGAVVAAAVWHLTDQAIDKIEGK